MSPLFVMCPTCRRKLDWETAGSRPFCSERCRLVDLGAWVSEQRVIPGEPAVLESGEAPDPDSVPD